MKRFWLVILGLVFYASYSFAFEASIETGKTKEVGKSRALEQKKDLTKGSGIETTIELSAVFLPVIREMENKSEGPFGSCKLLTKPKLLKDFGLSAMVEPGVIDTIKAEFINQSATANSVVAAVEANEAMIKRYRNCMALYGAVIAQSFAEVATVGNSLLTLEDARKVAEAAIKRVLSRGLNEPLMTKYEGVLTDNEECRFAGKTDEIQCGGSLVHIGGQPRLSVNGVEWYGGGKYAGYVGSFKLTANASKSKAVVMAINQKWSATQSAKSSVSPSKLLPHP